MALKRTLPQSEHAPKGLSIFYVSYSDIEAFICDPQWDRRDVSFLSTVPTSLVKFYQAPAATHAIQLAVLRYIRGLASSAYGTVADFGILALHENHWRTMLSTSGLLISEQLKFAWSRFELQGDAIYVFVPETTFALDDMTRVFDMSLPECLLVSIMSIDPSRKMTFLFTEVTWRELQRLISTHFPRERIEAVVLSSLGTFEGARLEQLHLILEQNQTTLKLDVMLEALEPLLAAAEDMFSPTGFADPAGMLGRLDRYFRLLKGAIPSGSLAALYTTIVQCSSWGKSRFVEQLLHRYPGCFTCFRLPRGPERSFPGPGIWASVFLAYFEGCKGSAAVSEAEKELFSLLYVCALVLSVEAYLAMGLPHLLGLIAPLADTEYAAVVEDLRRKVSNIEAGTGARDTACHIRCSLLVLGQLNSKSNAFGALFLTILRCLLVPTFPRLFAALKVHVRPDLNRWGISDDALNEKFAEMSQFCRHKGFAKTVLKRIGEQVRESSGANVSISHVASGIIGALTRSVERVTAAHSMTGRELMILAFDEATLLTGPETEDVHGIVPFRYLRRTLFMLRQVPLAAVFIGTNLTIVNFYSQSMMASDRLGVEGKILQPLVLLPGKDIWVGTEGTVVEQEELHEFLQEMGSANVEQCRRMFLDKFSCYGRPVWRLMKDKALELATQKLGFDHLSHRLNEAEFQVRSIAALAACCVLESSPSYSLATVLVRSFMATLMNIDIVNVPSLICTYISEPVLAAAAASALFCTHDAYLNLDEAATELHRTLILGATNKGASAELIARILLMASRARGLDLVFRPISVETFVLNMLLPEEARTTAPIPDHLQPFCEQLGDFAGMRINFVQFLQMNRRDVDGHVITSEGLFESLRRACAFSTIQQFEGIDVIIPVSMAASQVGYIGVQVKCRVRAVPMNPKEVFDKMTKAYLEHADADVLNPLNVFIQLGGTSGTMTASRFDVERYVQVAVSDSPSAALYKAEVQNRSVFFLHIYSVDAFAGAVRLSETRDTLQSIITWGLDLVELSAVTQMSEDIFDRQVLLYGVDAAAVGFKTRTLNTINEQYWPFIRAVLEILPPDSDELD